MKAMARRRVPSVVGAGVTDAVPLEAAINVPFVSVGVLPSTVYRMFAPAVAVVIVTVMGSAELKCPPPGLNVGKATWGME